MRKLRDLLDLFLATHQENPTLSGVKVLVFCPSCKERLHLLPEARLYQNLLEHVGDPNSEPPSKPAFGCCNADCLLFNHPFNGEGPYFDPWGDVYNLPREKEWKKRDIPTALGSGSFWSNRMIKEKNKKWKEEKARR